MKRLIFAAALIVVGTTAGCKKQPASYADCILANVKPDMTDQAVTTVRGACQAKFPQPYQDGAKAADDALVAAEAAMAAAREADPNDPDLAPSMTAEEAAAQAAAAGEAAAREALDRADARMEALKAEGKQK